MKRNCLKDSEKYAVLAACYADDAREGTYTRPEDIGGYRTKMVRAGDYLYISCYPLIGFNADRQQRKRLEELGITKDKDLKLRRKYQRYNQKRKIRGFEQLVHANMEPGDLHVVCTYAMQDYEFPDQLIWWTREEVKRAVYNYLRRVKRLLKKHGCDLKEFRWICVTVTKESNKEAVKPRPDQHHHHILMHGVPAELRNEIERLWPHGYCNADRLQDSDKGLAAIAGYVARQESALSQGEPGFTTSRNIIKPRITTNDSKISRRRAALIAADVRVNGREIFEKLYPGFRMVEDPEALTSDFTAGAYIYAKLRRMPQGTRPVQHMRN